MTVDASTRAQVIVVESHYAVGGAAHGFSRKTARGEFKFDTGPSFFAGLTKPNALNPLASVFRLLGEELETVKYDPLGTFHIEPDAPGLRRHASLAKLVSEVKRFSPNGAAELERAVPKIRTMYASLSGLPTTALRADWKVALMIMSRYMKAMAGLGPYSGVLPQPTVKLLDFLDIKDPWMRYLADLECFLLSGVDASGTVAAEFAAVFGASDNLGVSEFPRGGAEAIAKALQRGLEKNGGEVRLRTHVDEIIVENGAAVGVKLANGKGEIRAPIVLSNASVWDTYGKLLPRGAVPEAERKQAMETPYSESFMHLHLGIDGAGLDFSRTGGHHVVVLDKSKPVSEPGNVCMISIATVWEPNMAPEGCHCVHAYTMEPFEGWEELKAKDKAAYEMRKKEASDKLYIALERVIPDIRSRVLLELIASPATHKSWLRRHKGTYGAAIRAPAMFPGPAVNGVRNLYRVGDSVAPGVGVPAAAGSGVIAANTLASLDQHFAAQDAMDVLNAR